MLRDQRCHQIWENPPGTTNNPWILNQKKMFMACWRRLRSLWMATMGPMFPIPMCQWDLIGTKKTSKLLKSAGEAFTQTHTHTCGLINGCSCIRIHNIYLHTYIYNNNYYYCYYYYIYILLYIYMLCGTRCWDQTWLNTKRANVFQKRTTSRMAPNHLSPRNPMFQLTELTVFTHWINMTKFHQIHTINPIHLSKTKKLRPQKRWSRS